jgi:lipopolysaccharide/colanic/teichoic acid biosynthesis glycosyltransferase
VTSGPPSDDPIFVLPARFTSASGRAQLVCKRAFDVVGSAAGLLILSPLLLLLSLLIWLQSGWPVLFSWNVVGLRGRPFTGFKFRTMVRDAEQMEASLAAHNEMSGPAFKMRSDPRVTRMGRVLRRYSLDELPQLWSVLVGDMSLVGPRPPRLDEYARFAPWHRRRLAVTPGITCLWQVSGRADINDFDDWVRLDIAYIDSWSLLLDFTILFRTIGAVVRGKGAY